MYVVRPIRLMERSLCFGCRFRQPAPQGMSPQPIICSRRDCDNWYVPPSALRTGIAGKAAHDPTPRPVIMRPPLPTVKADRRPLTSAEFDGPAVVDAPMTWWRAIGFCAVLMGALAAGWMEDILRFIRRR